MFTRCCIGLLLLSLLPVAIAARTTPPRDAVRHGVRPDTILLRAAELTVGLPCDSAYLRRRDSVRCHDSLRLRAEERNRRLPVPVPAKEKP